MLGLTDGDGMKRGARSYNDTMIDVSRFDELLGLVLELKIGPFCA